MKTSIVNVNRLIGSISKLFPLPDPTPPVVAPEPAPEPKPRLRVTALAAPVEPRTRAKSQPVAQKPRPPRFSNGRLRFQSEDDFEAWQAEVAEARQHA